jgi:hypothetical protein
MSQISQKSGKYPRFQVNFQKKWKISLKSRKLAKKKVGKKGLSFISNRQRRKEGTLRASGLAGIEPTSARPNGAGYARLNLSATAGQKKLENLPKKWGSGISQKF